jgi:phosphate:Na+ symporter
MIDILSKVLLGLGLMFTGVQMLSSGLKQMGSRPFRIFAAQSASSNGKALLFGIGSGVIMQSTSAALMILASLISAAVLNVPQAIAILTGFSVGNCVLLFIVSMNISIGIMFLVGISGIAMFLTRDERYLVYCRIGLGLGLIFFGNLMMSAGVKPLREEAWFTGAMEFSRNYSLLSIIVGAALGFIVQSSTAVGLVAIGLARENILSGPQTFLFMYGAAIGSTMFKVMLGQAFRGTSRQLVRFVNLFNIFGASVFILMYYIEVYLQIPLLMALLNFFKLDLVHQAAWVFLLFNLTSAVFFIAINGPLTRWLERSLPPSEEEGLSQPKYLSEFQAQDPDTALEMIYLEQTREMGQIAAFIATARIDYEGATLDLRHNAFKSLAGQVAAALTNVAAMPMLPQKTKEHAFMQTHQTLLEQLADSTASGVKIILKARTYPSMEGLSDACMESVEFLLNFAAEIEKTKDKEDIRMFLTLSSSNAPSMEKLRKAYIDNDKLVSAISKGCLLDLTMETEKIFWLLNGMLSHLVPDREKEN